jgi:glycine/D-amino acid oxidase-like deaminating enzyme
MAEHPASSGDYDLAVVGAGIVGLAHAYAAARRGARVVVIERDLAANGASIRNFGFITVTGQARGEVWRLARRTRDLWTEIAPAAGVASLHRGLVLTLRRRESVALAEAFLATEMGEARSCWTPRRCAPATQSSPRRTRWARSSARMSCGWNRAKPCRAWLRGWPARTASTSSSARRRSGSSRRG